jgi:parallel beta-helix repeat protein
VEESTELRGHNLTNTTFSNNDEAIYNYSSDKTTVANSTFSGNRYGIYSFAPMTVENTIIAASTTDNCNGTISDGPANNHQGHNLEYGTTTTASSCGFTTTSANPMLGPLIDNGGPTQTFALPPGSPAIDTGGTINPCIAVGVVSYLCAADQRGIGRPQRGAYDIGAFELAAPNAVPVPRPAMTGSGGTPNAVPASRPATTDTGGTPNPLPTGR